MAETRTQVQIRLVLEQQCREVAELIDKAIPAATGFALFMADMGPKGNFAYVSNVQSEDVAKLVRMWLEKRFAGVEVSSVERIDQLEEALDQAADYLENAFGRADGVAYHDAVAKAEELRAIVKGKP